MLTSILLKQRWVVTTHRRSAVILTHSSPPRHLIPLPPWWLRQVLFESKYCIACFWQGQQPETSFITHFLKTEKCNQFSLARNSTYNPLLLDHYRLSRCAAYTKHIMSRGLPR